MLEYIVSLAQNPATPLLILVGAVSVVVVECWKASPKALMGDLYTERYDD